MIYKTAIIGCGRIGCGFDDKSTQYIKTHAGAYSKCKKTQLVALCDIDKSKQKKYGKKYKISNINFCGADFKYRYIYSHSKAC